MAAHLLREQRAVRSNRTIPTKSATPSTSGQVICLSRRQRRFKPAWSRQNHCSSIAQRIRASGYGPLGREFDSLWRSQNLNMIFPRSSIGGAGDCQSLGWRFKSVWGSQISCGPLAQLARALPLQGKCRSFKSNKDYQIRSSVAQQAERVTVNH